MLERLRAPAGACASNWAAVQPNSAPRKYLELLRRATGILVMEAAESTTQKSRPGAPSRSRVACLVDRKLLPQGEVLEHQRAPRRECGAGGGEDRNDARVQRKHGGTMEQKSVQSFDFSVVPMGAARGVAAASPKPLIWCGIRAKNQRGRHHPTADEVKKFRCQKTHGARGRRHGQVEAGAARGRQGQPAGGRRALERGHHRHGQPQSFAMATTPSSRSSSASIGVPSSTTRCCSAPSSTAPRALGSTRSWARARW